MIEANNKAFAEVVESCLQRWTAQSWIWDDIPPFGSLLSIQTEQDKVRRTIFGLVFQIQTGAADSNRSPFVYKKTIEELKREQPQIFEFLKTTFSVVTLGYIQDNKRYYQLAPCPPAIHSFVQRAQPDLYREFFADNRYMYMLFNALDNVVLAEELVLAHLKDLAERKLLHVQKVEELIQIFSLLTGNDYRRIKMLLQRVESLL